MDEKTPGTPPPMGDDDKKDNSVSDSINEAASEVKDAFNAPPPSTEGAVLGAGKLSESDERTMGMLAHLLGGFTSFVGPLVIWLIKKDESPFVDDQGKEALNFQILVGISYVVCMIGTFIPVAGCIFSLGIIAVVIINFIFCIMGCLEANKGVAYRYPFNLRLIS